MGDATDPADLQAKIAKLAGQINKHKQQAPPTFSHHTTQYQRGSSRWTPYGRPRGRGGAASLHRNRTLVLAGQNGAPDASPDEQARSVPSPRAPRDAPPREVLVSTRKAGVNQLMNTNTFERERQQKADHFKQVKATATNSSTKQRRQLEVDGIPFEIKEDGSKLIRISSESAQRMGREAQLSGEDEATASRETPKTAKVADVEFLRTKRGNLIRTNTGKAPERYFENDAFHSFGQDLHTADDRPAKRARKPQCENFTKYGTYISHHHDFASHATPAADRDPPRTIMAGTCSFGPACRFTHDPSKIAICKDFLRNGSCRSGRSCDLSHEPTYHRVPACTHFLRGNCTNNACRYPHVNVSPTARVCRAFATLGYCAKGSDCDNRHVFECPDHSNHGHCAAREKGSCQLPHIDRAGTLRKAAERQAKTGSKNESDMSSSEEEFQENNSADDIDSDIAEEDVVMGSDNDGHPLSQQQDFIAFH